MMPKTIIIASGKGGTGKTLASINLSIALSYLDHKVLLIDGNMTKPNLFFHFEMAKEKTIHDVYKKNNHPREIISTHPSGLNLIFGSPHIEDIEHIDQTIFKKMVNYFQKNLLDHEFIFIDTCSNYTEEFYNTANIADEAIIITLPDKVSLHEAKKTIQICDDEGASVTGIIINGNQDLDIKTIDHIQHQLGRPILGVLPHDKNVHKSIQIGHPVLCSYPNSEISKAFLEIGKKFSILNSHSKK